MQRKYKNNKQQQTKKKSWSRKTDLFMCRYFICTSCFLCGENFRWLKPWTLEILSPGFSFPLWQFSRCVRSSAGTLNDVRPALTKEIMKTMTTMIRFAIESIYVEARKNTRYSPSLVFQRLQWLICYYIFHVCKWCLRVRDMHACTYILSIINNMKWILYCRQFYVFSLYQLLL